MSTSISAKVFIGFQITEDEFVEEYMKDNVDNLSKDEILKYPEESCGLSSNGISTFIQYDGARIEGYYLGVSICESWLNGNYINGDAVRLFDIDNVLKAKLKLQELYPEKNAHIVIQHSIL